MKITNLNKLKRRSFGKLSAITMAGALGGVFPT